MIALVPVLVIGVVTLGLGLVAVLLVRLAAAAVTVRGVDLQPDFHAGILVFNRLGVQVPAAVVTSGAGPESGRAVVGKVSIFDAEAGVRLGTNIALLLRGGWGQDAAAVFAVVEAWQAVSEGREGWTWSDSRPSLSSEYFACGIGRLHCPTRFWPSYN